jgi:hypothetical protein
LLYFSLLSKRRKKNRSPSFSSGLIDKTVCILIFKCMIKKKRLGNTNG